MTSVDVARIREAQSSLKDALIILLYARVPDETIRSVEDLLEQMAVLLRDAQ